MRSIFKRLRKNKRQNLSDRIRYNDPLYNPSRHPTTKDIVILLKHLAIEYNKISKTLKKMSEVLKNDKKFHDGKDKEIHRRIVQNNFDAIRYCSPMFKNICLLKILVRTQDDFVTILRR